ncbi:MAG: PIN domain-containing protein, partial [Sphaerospermopsis kisseleviana]
AENFIQNIAVITLDNNAVKKFGELKAELRKIGQQVADFDLLIASVALTRNYILVTNNTRHYSRISELKLENWVSP